MTEGIALVRRALLSVWDKAGLAELAKELHALGVELISTGSTARVVREAGVPVTEVSEVTGFPEIMDGRVKTLHPAIHGGLLADRSKAGHRDALAQHGFEGIDLLVSNLYPFRETIADPAVSEPDAIEMIDIGGPAMTRAAAKNSAHVTVVVDPADYDAVLDELRAQGGIGSATRRRLAGKAFARTAAYDADIAAWMARDEAFPDRYGPVYRKAGELRYGENPHQTAAYYVERGAAWGLGSAVQHGGKELSYNNLLDTDAAWGAVSDFADPCVAIIKHANPAGLAVAPSLAEAYPRALAGDEVSAYGGIVAANRRVDETTARQIVEVFTEVVVAPGYDDEALAVLRTKKNLRILELTRAAGPERVLAVRSVSGGLLVQDADVAPEEPSAWTVPTREQPGDAQLAELAFAWQVCKHVRSNAIVLSRDRALVGMGAGQPSRVDSVRLAIDKSGGRVAGAVLASDAFFPFRDGPDLAIDAGVTAIVQPGGSVRDADVVAACDERGIPMVFTGRRHFRH
jgi:phosphoribosylaminoimidazolecarboxamide formyltransferase/IMP cyclohydrolase